MNKETEKIIKDAIENLEDEIYRREKSGMYLNDVPALKDKKNKLEQDLRR